MQNKQLQNTTLLILAVCVLMCRFNMADEVKLQKKVNTAQKNIRIAVIDVGSKAAPSSFAELFWVLLTEIPNVELVERDLIEKILKEQTLNLLFGDRSDAAHAIRAGKLMRAEVLLMLESGKPVQGQIPIRLRLVETQYGLKFWDGAILLDRNESKHPVQAQEIAGRLINKLKTKTLREDYIFIGLGTIRSEELSQRWNWIADELAAGVEQHLITLPSIVLLERRRTRPLMDERSLVADLPESLRSSAVFLDGSFRFDRDNDKNTVQVTIHGYSTQKRIFTITVEGNVDALPLLTERIVAAVTDELNVKSENTVMDRRKEAKLLMAQARSLVAFEDYRGAVALYEAAVAVDPNAIEAMMGLMRLGAELSGINWRSKIKGGNREMYKREIVPLLLNNIEMARRLVDNYIAGNSKHKPMPHSKRLYERALDQALDVFRYPPVVKSDLGNQDDTLEILRTFQIQLSELYPVFLEAVKDDKGYLYPQIIHQGVTRGFWWASSPQQYLDDLQGWLELSAQERPHHLWSSNFFMTCSFQFGICPLWSDRQDNAQRYLEFLTKLSRHTNPLLRTCAHQGFVRYYFELDKKKTAEHYKIFIETIINDVIPAFPEWGHAMGIWNANIIYKVREAVGEHYIAQANARITHKVLECSPRFHMGWWRDTVRRCYRDLERTGQTDKAVLLLTACKDKLQKVYPHEKDDLVTIDSWLRALKEKHPELEIDIELIPTEECNPLKLLDTKDISRILENHGLAQKENYFSRLLIDEKTAAIVCVWDLLMQAKCGVVWLNPESFTFRSFQMYELPTSFSMGGHADLRWISYRGGPASAICGDTVYVSFPGRGIIIFPDGGKPQFMCEENGLPSNMISSMDAMNGRLYAVTGFLHSTGLIEIEPDSFKTKILISPKNRVNPHPLDGSNIVDVTADRWANRLWLSMDPNDRRSCDVVYCYDPDTALASPVPEEIIRPSFHIRLQRQGHFLNISTYTALYTVDLSTQEITLIAQHSVLNVSRQERSFWQTDLRLANFAGNSKMMICAARDEGGQSFNVIFNAGENGPRKITGKFFPSVESIRDFGRTQKGLLILTQQSLSIIPESIEN